MSKTRIRETPRFRKAQILDAALKVAQAKGYHLMTREDIAAAAGVSTGLISKYFITMRQLKRRVLKEAIDRSVLHVIQQGIHTGDQNLRTLKREIREKLKTLYD